MKRKFKLFATLASLCLSVALMAFGVYAATNVTYNVNSSVSFAAQVSGTWTSEVRSGTISSGTVTWSNDAVASDTWTLAGGELENGTANARTWNIDGNGDSAGTDLEFNPGQALNYFRYTIRFASDSARPCTIAATPSALFANSGLTVRVQESVGSSAPEVQATTTGDVVGILNVSHADVAAEKAIPSATNRAAVPANGYYLLVIEVELSDFRVSFNADNLLTLVITAWADGYTPPANNNNG